MTGKIKDLGIDYSTTKAFVTFEIENKEYLKQLEELRNSEKPLEMKIDYEKKQRTLDQNAMLWSIIGMLSKKLGIPKEKIYYHLIKEMSVTDIVPIRNDAVGRFRTTWRRNGLGWLTETIPSKLDGFTNVVCYYGSSALSTVEFSHLIDLLLQECSEQGIIVPTKEEILKLRRYNEIQKEQTSNSGKK